VGCKNKSFPGQFTPVCRSIFPSTNRVQWLNRFQSLFIHHFMEETLVTKGSISQGLFTNACNVLPQSSIRAKSAEVEGPVQLPAANLRSYEPRK